MVPSVSRIFRVSSSMAARMHHYYRHPAYCPLTPFPLQLFVVKRARAFNTSRPSIARVRSNRIAINSRTPAPNSYTLIIPIQEAAMLPPVISHNSIIHQACPRVAILQFRSDPLLHFHFLTFYRNIRNSFISVYIDFLKYLRYNS